MTDDPAKMTIQDLRDRLNAAICAAAGRDAAFKQGDRLEAVLRLARSPRTESEMRDALEALRGIAT